jgi:hypothetical protein
METNTRSMPIALFTNKTGNKPKVALGRQEVKSLFI